MEYNLYSYSLHTSNCYTTLTRLRNDLSGVNDPVAQGPQGSIGKDHEAKYSLSNVKLKIADKSTDIDPFDTNWIDIKHHKLLIEYDIQSSLSSR